MTETGRRHIRQATAADLDALYEICLRTANAGEDGTALYSHPKLPGEIWSAPYGVLAPEHAFVLDDGGRVIGYVVAAPDSAQFAQTLDEQWWPKVRERFAGFEAKTEADANVLRLFAAPEPPLDYLLEDYPAHLHINVLPEAQSGGWGRKLIEHQLNALRQAGAVGVHLGVNPRNERAKGFYRHVGFADVSRDDKVSFAMALV